jgi:hypothetical protein
MEARPKPSPRDAVATAAMGRSPASAVPARPDRLLGP